MEDVLERNSGVENTIEVTVTSVREKKRMWKVFLPQTS